jgi:hypothetical protein
MTMRTKSQNEDTTMLNTTDKIIKHKTGLLNLTEALGNVSKACQFMGYSRDIFYRYNSAVDEGGIKAFVMGRKAWLFFDMPAGADASERPYSLIDTAKANGPEPYTYLRHVLAELPRAKTEAKIEALLPWNIVLVKHRVAA